MKKTLTAVAVSSALVLGLAVASHAEDTTTAAVAAGATKVTIDGNMRVRGAYDKSLANKDVPGSSYYDNRVQLGVKAQVSPEATGYVKLETGADNSDINYWGERGGDSATPLAGNNLHNGGDKLGTLNILEAWVNYQPGDFGVKAGHMPLALGNKVFFDHTLSGDDAIVAYGSLNGGATNLAALTIKFDEELTGRNSDDIDGYVALVTHKVNDDLTLGANYTLLNGGTSAIAPDMSMSNIGVTVDGKVGAISYMADGEFQFGTFYDLGTGAVGSESDAQGWAMKLGGNYDLGAGKIGLLFGYGSGADKNDSAHGGTNGDYDQNEFINFLGDTTYDTIIAGYRAAIPGVDQNGNTSNAAGKNTGLSNLTIYQLNGSTKTVDPLTGKDLSLFASVSYLQLSEEIYDLNGNSVDKVGTELDLIASWALTPGLTYKIEAAYLFVGDVFENSIDLGTDNNPDDLMFLRHSLDVKF